MAHRQGAGASVLGSGWRCTAPDAPILIALVVHKAANRGTATSISPSCIAEMSIYEDANAETTEHGSSTLSIPDYGGRADGSEMAAVDTSKRPNEGFVNSTLAICAGSVERLKAVPIVGKAVIAAVVLVAAAALLWEGDAAYGEFEAKKESQLAGIPVGRFVAGRRAMNWDEAQTFCSGVVDGIQLAGLASIHTYEEQRLAVQACHSDQLSTTWAGTDARIPHGCWIGLNDVAVEGGFVWTDGSAVDYVNWYSGEPNEYGGSAAST